MSAGLIDELIHVLERRQADGEDAVFLTPDVRDAFLAPVLHGEMKRKQEVRASSVPPSRPPQRTSAPPKPPSQQPRVPTVETPSSARPVTPVSTPPTLVPQGDVSGLGMDALRERVAACTACPLHAQRKQTVFADGDPAARLMFIGEGPGYDEDMQGVPFVGKAGQLLTRMIQAMQFDRSEVYIANIVKCRPPKNRNPEDSEAAQCLPFLKRQIELVAPEVIVLLGAVPLKYLLNETGINRCHGQWFDFNGIPVLPTFHPAYLLRVEAKKREAWEDLKKVMAKLGKNPSKTSARR